MKTVYLCFSSDIIHSGHLNIIRRAQQYGRVIAGVLCDQCAQVYEQYPLLPQEERVEILKGIRGISEVVIQPDIFYDSILQELKPDYVAHGDNWLQGYQQPIRERVIEVLAEWGGELLEFPYTQNVSLSVLGGALQDRLGFPETRKQRLAYQLRSGQLVRVLEAHDALSALIVEKASVERKDGVQCFDAIWASSLCDSAINGKPDIELVDLTSRLQKINEILEVTTKPIIFDADSGGVIEHFVYNVRTLERTGVSAVIIEDKIGLKKNSLFGASGGQSQDSVEHFCEKIRQGKQALKTRSFLLIARIESLILEQGMEDALQRAFAYIQAGADAIMIHSCRKTPEEIFEFCDRFRKQDSVTPLVVVPTTYHSVTESELKAHGVNMVIYANHLLRAAFPAMKSVAESILRHGRAQEASQQCMPIKEILSIGEISS